MKSTSTCKKLRWPDFISNLIQLTIIQVERLELFMNLWDLGGSIQEVSMSFIRSMSRVQSQPAEVWEEPESHHKTALAYVHPSSQDWNGLKTFVPGTNIWQSFEEAHLRMSERPDVDCSEPLGSTWTCGFHCAVSQLVTSRDLSNKLMGKVT